MSKVVLIVEDELVLQDVYKIVLTAKGYDVHTANNGLEGVALMKALRPSLVLLDIFMPVMDGKEFLRNIDLDTFKESQVVICSNLSDSETQEEMLGLGATKFVLKSSMSPLELTAMVEEMIGKPELNT